MRARSHIISAAQCAAADRPHGLTAALSRRVLDRDPEGRLDMEMLRSGMLIELQARHCQTWPARWSTRRRRNRRPPWISHSSAVGATHVQIALAMSVLYDGWLLHDSRWVLLQISPSEVNDKEVAALFALLDEAQDGGALFRGKRRIGEGPLRVWTTSNSVVLSDTRQWHCFVMDRAVH